MADSVIVVPLIVLAAVPAAAFLTYFLARMAAYGWHRGRYKAELHNTIESTDQEEEWKDG